MCKIMLLFRIANANLLVCLPQLSIKKYAKFKFKYCCDTTRIISAKFNVMSRFPVPYSNNWSELSLVNDVSGLKFNI